MDRFIHGYANRLIPIEIPTVENTGKTKYYMHFIGRQCSEEDYQAHLKDGTLSTYRIKVSIRELY